MVGRDKIIKIIIGSILADAIITVTVLEDGKILPILVGMASNIHESEEV